MSRLLILVNLVIGLFLFFAMSDMVASWNYFTTSGTKLAAFILGIVAIGNAVYLACGNRAGAIRHR
jgi:hypothetical protein